MFRNCIARHITSLFIIAFVCLNAGGAVCVAYCQSALEAIAASEEHWPLKKKAAHCDPAQSDQQEKASAAVGNEINCCPMTLSFVGAPFEKRTFHFETAEFPVIAKSDFAAPATLISSRQTFPPAYRGPPRDRRVERLKHCIIRI
ncbi:MAG: hypothetical protein AB7F88_07945 [Pyrinomonadaceae bacterium]